MARTLTVALALVLAGCGTKTPTSAPTAAPRTPSATASPTPPPLGLTHAEFVRTLNESCSRGKERADKLLDQFQSAMDNEDLAAASKFYAQILPLQYAHVARVERLTPPTVDAAAFRRYISAQRRISGYGARIVKALQEEDIDKVQRLAVPFQRESERRLTAAVDIGADKCGG